MIISIASGKGGTGKTTFTMLLAKTKNNVSIVDCDVEEPNCHLFMQPTWENQNKVNVLIPQINQQKCTGCGRCAKACLYNALVIANKKALLFDELCHSCGSCLLACPEQAINEGKKIIGEIAVGTATATCHGTKLISGNMNVGVPSGVPLIKAVKKHLPKQNQHILLDCPPGTSCSMVAAVSGSDFCILVTEPTPFGRHDLELALNIIKLLKMPCGVVINKSDNSTLDQDIEVLCKQNNIPVLARIPYSPEFAQNYASGTILDKYKDEINTVWQKIEDMGANRK